MKSKPNKPSHIKASSSSLTSSKTLSILLIPMSIILVGVLVSVSVLISANSILERDQLVTKTNLKSIIDESLRNANLSAGGATPTPTPVVVSQDLVDTALANQPIVMGNKSAKIKVIEFSDPSCPFCSLAAGNAKYTASYPGYIPSMPKIEEMAKQNKLSYTWIYLPTHGVGEVAAHLYYCANEKGKFWEVHNLLMVNEGYELVEATVKNDFSQTAKLADFVKGVVDRDFIMNCVNSKKYADRLTQDIALAGKFGANATPAFYVGTEAVDGSDYSAFEALFAKYE
jgi:protein-disulfide isomerase